MRILFSSSVAQLRFIYALSPQLQIDLQTVFDRFGVVQEAVNACCDFTVQCVIVRINHSIVSICFIHLNFQRSTVVGSSGVKIFVL